MLELMVSLCTCYFLFLATCMFLFFSCFLDLHLIIGYSFCYCWCNRKVSIRCLVKGSVYYLNKLAKCVINLFQ